MTKAEIVNEISLKTGAGRKEVLQIVEGFMESVKASLASRRKCVSERIWQLHLETPCRESGPEYH